MKNHSLLQALKALLATAFLIASTSAAMAQADVGLFNDATNQPYANGSGLISYGNVTIGNPAQITVRVQNTGSSGSLIPGAISIIGPNASEFSVSAINPAGPLTANQTATFVVTCNANVLGVKNATLRLATNIPGKNPYEVDLSATITAPIIGLQDPLGSFANNSFPARDVGQTPLGTSTTRQFTIRNDANAGGGRLTGISVNISGGGGRFTAENLLSTTVNQQSFTTFVVRFTPGTATGDIGQFVAQASISSNDPSTPTFNINLTAEGTAPLFVLSSGANVSEGTTVSLEDATLGTVSKAEFTIRNNGTAPMTGFAITKDGANPGDFSVTAGPTASTLAVGATATFEISFQPQGVLGGSRTANFRVANNDPRTGGTFDFVVRAEAIKPVNKTDSYGYRLTDVPFDETELKDTDTDVVSATFISGSDDKSQGIGIGFPFSFYDRSYTSCVASTNGLLMFAPAATVRTNSFSPTQIPPPVAPGPNSTDPTNFLAPFWTDLYPTPDSRILYATRQQAPNRVFIIQWDKWGHFSHRDKFVTFQVRLYEGTNTIEFHYKSIDADYPTFGQNLSIGIESRNYATDPDLAGRLNTLLGLPYRIGAMNNNSLPNEAFPTARRGLRFTRPVAVTVQSQYQTSVSATPVNVGSPARGLNPSFDIFPYNFAQHGDEKRFEAPAFIYLNRNFEELDEVGDLNASDTPPNLRKAWYRLRNLGYSVDGLAIQGTDTFFTIRLTADVTVVWRWQLEYAVVVDLPTGQGAFGNPTPVAGRHWYTRGQQFNASIDSVIADQDGRRFRTIGYTLFDKAGTAIPNNVTFPTDGADTRAILPQTVTDPLRLVWNFIGQVRYRFDALSGGSLQNGRSFVRVYSATDRSQPDTSFAPNGIVYGNGTNTEVWVDLGRKVDVGAYYRSGNVTLSGFAGAPSGDLAAVGSVETDLNDDTTVPTTPTAPFTFPVSRLFTVRSASTPSDIHWLYSATIFRAEIPIGESLDALNPAVQPSLGSVSLRADAAGPGTFINRITQAPLGSVTSGDPLRWDAFGQALFPVQPGVYRIDWPDANDNAKTYPVEIITGYPGDQVTRPSAFENPDGSRQRNGVVDLTGVSTTDGSATVSCNSTTGLQSGMLIRGANVLAETTVASVISSTSFTLSSNATATASGQTLSAWTSYRNQVTLRVVDPAAGYPAQPEGAHYYHIFDSDPAKQAPTRLDLSTLDEWKFQDLVYADPNIGAAVAKATDSKPFSATAEGRSVLLFSYRPNPDEIADGSLDREKLAVRIVRSKPLAIIPRTDSKLVLGQRGLQLGSGSAALGGAFGILAPGGSPVTSLAPGSQFVIDLWLNAKDLAPAGTVTVGNSRFTAGNATITATSTIGLAPGMTLSGAGIPAGTKIVRVIDATNFSVTPAPTATSPGSALTASFAAVTLTNCTTNGTIDVTCESTAGLVAGMSISGQNIPPAARIAEVKSATELVLTLPATASATGLTLTTSNRPVTIFTSSSGGLKLTLDAAASTVTANYKGLVVTHPFPRSGAGWHHLVLHAFNQEIFGTGTTVFDFYLDGLRGEQALPTTLVTASADSTVASGLTAASFRFGVDVDPQQAIQIDQFRLFTFPTFPTDSRGYLTGGELRNLRDSRDATLTPTTVVSKTAGGFVLSQPATATGTGLTLTAGGVTLTNCATQFNSTSVTCNDTTDLVVGSVVQGLNIVADTRLRTVPPALWFSFERELNAVNDVPPAAFLNKGSLAVTVGPITTDAAAAGAWANVDLQEVATRIDSTLDRAGFGGSGYIRNGVSNYNPSIYTRTAEVGGWGSIFPVNTSTLFTDAARKLEVIYYENPYLVDRVTHPNIAWPYAATEYANVTFPAVGPHRNKAIYIASRIGSEGIDQTGRPQKIYDLSQYANLSIYSQPNKAAAGYNPNEEHAIVAPSGRASLFLKNLGETVANNPPLAAYALQKDLNNIGGTTSDPWVLVQVNNLATGEPEMAAYQVFATRSATVASAIPFPRPADSQTGGATGLAYEAASTPESRFLTLNPAGIYNFKYDFDYPVFAGDLLIPPYPLNLVIGNVQMVDERGGNIQVNGVNQRTLWRDVSGHAWIVSGGGGRFFNQFFYPMRADFYLPSSDTATGDLVPQRDPGTPVAWLPVLEGAALPSKFIGNNQPGIQTGDPQAVKVRYTSAWRSDYPKLKRGETLTYQGGEYFSETPGSQGLPAVVAMKAAEIVYDSATPSMIIGEATVAELDKASARIIRPLDRREVSFTSARMAAAGFQPGDPGTSKVLVVAERWYFKDLPGSLQKRFYFDSLAEKLVFRGRLNDKEGGDPNLTAGPDPLNVLEPGVMTLTDYQQSSPGKGLRDLSSNSVWTAAIDALFQLSQDPNNVRTPATSLTNPVFLQGVKPVPTSPTPQQQATLAEQSTFWTADLSGTVGSVPTPRLMQLDSFGVGSALVPNANLLLNERTDSFYITVAENNRAELNGAPVAVHIVEIIPDRYRGAIKVAEGADAFSEKISLQHNGDFGANTDNLSYEWWIRDSRELDDTLKSEIESLSSASPSPNWQLYKSGTGLHSVVFEGRPDVILADKLVLVRYRHIGETQAWKAVSLDLPDRAAAAAAWTPGAKISGSNVVAGRTVLLYQTLGTVPFQWAGAANSPQLQADGSKRYIPQLVMGWVKRVLDRINPYEARYTDFFGNESPASYSSQIQIAGGPYAGDVALNPDKNVIENVGLIELYQTVLRRARTLSIDNSSNSNATDGVLQAILLAATRLGTMYDLLAREAYSDAQDGTISVPEDSGLANAAPYTFAFQNLEPSLLTEELALLRGSDFRKSYPVYNRMFWNYTKGLGEAAYNVNYNIYDANNDGFINESDARKLYPQGHGDAWGHFLSALDMHYTLLQHPTFRWQARAELYSLLQNVLPVDYLDEKTFAKIAAGRARAGRDIVRATYRLNYTADPDGQWQGYTDSADKARAWGVSEWAHRAGQGAYFDWAVANAILPAQALDSATGKPLTDLSELERRVAMDEIGEIAGGLNEIQTAMDEANGGVNPLGLDSDAITFDLNQEFYQNNSGGDRRSHFEQIFERASTAGANAASVLQFATAADNKLRAIADDTNEIIVDSLRQDLDYRNRLIEIFGTPYTGQIGFGKAYPEGYLGPDTLLYAYLDKTKIDQYVPARTSTTDTASINFTISYNKLTGTEVMNNPTLVNLFKNKSSTALTDAFKTIVSSDSSFRLGSQLTDLSVPYDTASEYGFQAPTDWGRRVSYGSIQQSLQDMLAAEMSLDTEISNYVSYLQSLEQKIHRIQSEIEIYGEKESIKDDITGVRAGFTAATIAANAAIAITNSFSKGFEAVDDGVKAALKDTIVVGLAATIPTGPAQAAITIPLQTAKIISDTASEITKAVIEVAQLVRDEVIAKLERDVERQDQIREMEGFIEELENLTKQERPLRNAIGLSIQELEMAKQGYFTTLAEGFRVLREREAFNKVLAASVQKNRYQDMIFRLTRNEAMSKYQSSFNNAARYAWLAARAYDYETSLEPGDPAAPGEIFNKIVRERQLGLWGDGPQSGQGGLAEILAQMNSNFQALKGHLGIENPQNQIEKISLRSELFRIGPTLDPAIQAALDTPVADRTAEQAKLVADNQDAINAAAASAARFTDTLKARIVPDLTKLPEFVRYCRPFSTTAEGAQPGLVIRFSTEINNGVNVFGKALVAGDHKYSNANFATKLRAFGVWLSDYNAAGLVISPRAYLVPVGDDYLRTSSAAQSSIRSWGVKEQRIPIPFVINQANIGSPDFIPTMNGLDGTFGDLRRHGDFRMYHDNGDPEADDSELIYDNRLVGRSVWNSEWMLVIPGASLGADPMDAVTRFCDSVTDIKIYFDTYSHQGR